MNLGSDYDGSISDEERAELREYQDRNENYVHLLNGPIKRYCPKKRYKKQPIKRISPIQQSINKSFLDCYLNSLENKRKSSSIVNDVLMHNKQTNRCLDCITSIAERTNMKHQHQQELQQTEIIIEEMKAEQERLEKQLIRYVARDELTHRILKGPTSIVFDFLDLNPRRLDFDVDKLERWTDLEDLR